MGEAEKRGTTMADSPGFPPPPAAGLALNGGGGDGVKARDRQAKDAQATWWLRRAVRARLG